MLYYKYNGAGQLGEEIMEKHSFGGFFKERRQILGLTLRDFCRQNGFDWGNLSKIERGKMPPPTKREKLEEYAKALHIKPGCDDWIYFFDLAAASAGRIPKEIMEDENLVAKLPVLFRTVRGEPLSKEKLEELIKTIQEA